MQIHCPECQRRLRVGDDQVRHPIRCPACGGVFRLQPPRHKSSEHVSRQVASVGAADEQRGEEAPIPPPPRKQIYLAVDVSTSVGKYLPIMHKHLLKALKSIRDEGPFDLAVYLFHRHVMPFPTERLCRPLPYEDAHIPTLDDLRHRLGGGTAILDTMDRLIDDSKVNAFKNEARHSPTPAIDQRAIILTDGWERSSRRVSVDRLKRKIGRADWLDLSMVGFVDSQTYGRLAQLATFLGLPDNRWSFTVHDGDPQSVHDSISGCSLSVVDFCSSIEAENPSTCDSV